jgi:fatty acid desaturase
MELTDVAPTDRALTPRPPRALLVPQTTRYLIVQACLDWVIIGLCWAALASLPMWTWPVWMLIIGGRVHGLGVVLHDATHMPMRRKTWDFHVIEWLAGHPSCSTVSASRYHHLRHHRTTCTAADPYFIGGLLNNKRTLSRQRVMYVVFWMRFVILVPFWSLRGYFGTLALLRPGLRNAYARYFLQDRAEVDHTDSPEILGCLRAEVGQAISHSLVYAFALYSPGAFLIAFAIPWTIGGLACGYRLLMEHRYVEQEACTLSSTIATTRDHHVPVLGELLLGPRGISYHLTHHLHPTVGYQHLAAVAAWYRINHPDEFPRHFGVLPLVQRWQARRRLAALGLLSAES